MHAARDKPDQQSYFYVVWPEEKSSQESQVTLPSPQHPKEQSPPKMETAASTGSSADASATAREAATSHRFRESTSPTVHSPDADYLAAKQQVTVVTSPHTTDLSKGQPNPFSPVHPYRAQTAGHQIISLPAPAIVSLADPQQVLFPADPMSSKEGLRDTSHAHERTGEQPSVFSTAHKQLLHMTSPIVAGAPSLPISRGHEVENFRKIG